MVRIDILTKSDYKHQQTFHFWCFNSSILHILQFIPWAGKGARRPILVCQVVGCKKLDGKN